MQTEDTNLHADALCLEWCALTRQRQMADAHGAVLPVVDMEQKAMDQLILAPVMPHGSHSCKQ